jgi:thymidylate synthase
MKQYLDLLQNILDNGVEKESGRANMPNTIGISHGIIQMDLKDGFPLLTTKQVYYKMIIHELLWFLRGETNIKYLVDNNVNIWCGDSYRWYLKYFKEYSDKDIKELSLEDFVDVIKNNTAETLRAWFGSKVDYSLGDLGKVYGYQWRNQNGVDQIQDILTGLKENPYSRYHILDAWNKVDFKDMALPPCHLLYQFIVRPLSFSQRVQLTTKSGINFYPAISSEEWIEVMDKNNIPKFYLDLNMYQRSCDAGCGIPFNLASMSMLLMIMSNISNMIPGIATWIGGDTHLYLPHIDSAKEQIKRIPYKLPKLKINKKLNSLKDIEDLSVDDFILSDYKFHPSIKYELFAGVKK